MTPLRQRMIDAMVLRGFAQRTQWTYVTAVKQLARYHDCSPEGSVALSDFCQKIALILLNNFCWELLNATEPALLP